MLNMIDYKAIFRRKNMNVLSLGDEILANFIISKSLLNFIIALIRAKTTQQNLRRHPWRMSYFYFIGNKPVR